jgi:pyridoxal phosphate enzyme (YggS family)
MGISDNIKAALAEIPPHIKLVAISKTKPAEMIMEAYHAGQKIFGENKVQELCAKYEQLPRDIEWHMVGHLQTNKIKYIAHFVHLIHSVDSMGLLMEINKQGEKHKRKINCLLQVHIAKEETKFGFSEEELIQLIHSDALSLLKNVSICGLMGMATFTDDTNQIRNEFRQLYNTYESLKKLKFLNHPEFKDISMGMSSDYLIAIEEGSTIVRIGSKIFGERNYNL